MNLNNYTFFKEKNLHGNSAYPFAIYNVVIPESFCFFPMHCHDEVEIIYVSAGKGIITINLEPYLVTKGSIIFISPGMLHSMERFENETFYYKNIIFDLKMILTYSSDESTLNTVLPLISNKKFFPIIIDKDHSHNSSISQYIVNLQAVHDKKIPGYELAIKANIMLLLYQLTSKNLLLTDLNFLKSNTIKLKNLFTFINEHYADSITIQDAAKIYGCSPSNFMRFF